MATFLSEPLVSGYTTGAAVHVFTSQLRHIVGVPSSAVRVDPGVFALPRVCDFSTVFQFVCCNSAYVFVCVCVCVCVCACVHVTTTSYHIIWNLLCHDMLHVLTIVASLTDNTNIYIQTRTHKHAHTNTHHMHTQTICMNIS